MLLWFRQLLKHTVIGESVLHNIPVHLQASPGESIKKGSVHTEVGTTQQQAVTGAGRWVLVLSRMMFSCSMMVKPIKLFLSLPCSAL